MPWRWVDQLGVYHERWLEIWAIDQCWIAVPIWERRSLWISMRCIPWSRFQWKWCAWTTAYRPSKGKILNLFTIYETIVFWQKKPWVYQLPVYENYRKRRFGPMQCISYSGSRHVYRNILENSILFHRMGNMNWICSHKQSINAFWAFLKLGPGQTNSWVHRGY